MRLVTPNLTLNLRRTVALLALVALAACSSPATPGPTPLPANAQVISFAYASSAQAWLEPAIAAFNSTSTMTGDGKRIVIQGKPMGSGAIVESMIQGNSPYELIAPADKVWVDLLAARRKQRGEKALDIGACTTVARSPVVAITWQTMAEVLGWPEREFTWHDIADLALSPSAWQGYDHPEWGTLTFGHAHRILSNGGLAAALGEAYAAGPLTTGDVQSDVVTSYLRGVERSVARYGSDTSTLIKSMADKGQRFLHVAVGYESDVIANHQGDDPLVALYPKETFVANYVTCVVGNSAPASQFAKYLLSDGAQQAALRAGFRPAATGVALGAPIDTAHGADPNVAFKTIPMPSVDVIRAVQDVWSQLKRPLNVTLVIDISGSMNSKGKLPAARDGAKAFIERLGNDDTIAVYSFSSSARLIVPTTSVGPNRSTVVNAIGSLSAEGETALYDTIMQARQGIKPDSKRINAIVVLTDGQDTASRATKLDGLLATIQNAKGSVTIYTIGYGDDADGGVLEKIATAGNGSYFKGDPATINQVYLEIASQFGGSRGLGR
jgi:Ca-activated chloride channel homolog